MTLGPKRNFQTPSYNRFKASNKAKSVPPREYVDIDKALLEYYTGSFEIYKEYRAKVFGDKIVSLPLECCDPLPIYQGGDLRYFFTSAHNGVVTSCSGGGYNRSAGQPIKILNSDFNSILVVRGKHPDLYCKGAIYIGINRDNYKLLANGAKKIYSGTILFMDLRNAKNIDYPANGYLDRDNATYLNSDDMSTEIRKRLQDPKDFDERCPIYQQTKKELFKHQDDHDFLFGSLISKTCYWTQEENKLKGITYKSRAGNNI